VASSICFLLGYLSHTCIDSFRGDTASASDTAEVVRVVVDDDASKDVEANEFYYRASVGPSSTLMELWSTFYADLYSGDAAVIGMVDTDAVLNAHATQTSLFDDQGRPRVRGVAGFIATHRAWCDVNEFLIQRPCIGTFMSDGAFPFLYRRVHFASLREAIRIRLNVSHFNHAFRLLMERYGKNGGVSPFEIMYHYAWYMHHDEYAWHLRDVVATKLVPFFSPQPVPSEYSNTRTPVLRLMRHTSERTLSQRESIFLSLADYHCAAENFSTIECSHLQARDAIAQEVAANLRTEYGWATSSAQTRAGYYERGYMYYPKTGEQPWIE